MADSGLRISCAMLAVSRPSAASFSRCAACLGLALVFQHQHPAVVRRRQRNAAHPQLRRRGAQGGCRAGAQLLRQARQFGRDGVQPGDPGRHRRRDAEQRQRARAGVPHDAVAAHREQAVGRVLDRQRIDPVQQRQFVRLLLGQRFRAQRALGQRMRQPADGEVAGAQQAGLENAVGRWLPPRMLKPCCSSTRSMPWRHTAGSADRCRPARRRRWKSPAAGPFRPPAARWSTSSAPPERCRR
jgi:hypothetical protein